MPRRRLLTACLLVASACASQPGPRARAEAYARALEEGRLEEAWGQVASGGLTEEEFRAHYGEAAVRQQRAAEVRAGLDRLRAEAPGVSAVQTPEGWRIVEGRRSEAGPAATLEAFLAAAEAGDFTAAYALLAAPLRARYTPQLLERDFHAEPQAAERLARARAALAQGPRQEGEGRVRFPVGPEAAVQLVLEEGRWRVAGLE